MYLLISLKKGKNEQVIRFQSATSDGFPPRDGQCFQLSLVVISPPSSACCGLQSFMLQLRPNIVLQFVLKRNVMLFLSVVGKQVSHPKP